MTKMTFCLENEPLVKPITEFFSLFHIYQREAVGLQLVWEKKGFYRPFDTGLAAARADQMVADHRRAFVLKPP